MPYLRLGDKSNEFFFTNTNDIPIVDNKNENIDANNDAMIFSIEDGIASPDNVKTINHLDKPKEEDVVMVIPTTSDAEKELTIGFIFMLSSLIIMCLFMIFAILGYRHYRSLLNNKIIFKPDSNSPSNNLNERKNRFNRNIDHTDYLNRQKNSDKYKNSVMNISNENYESDIVKPKILEPKIAHQKSDVFKPTKLFKKTGNIKRYTTPNVECVLKSKQDLDTSLGLDTPSSIEELRKKNSRRLKEIKLNSKTNQNVLQLYKTEIGSNGLKNFINTNVNKNELFENVIKEEEKKKKENSFNNKSKKARYTIKELIELEPIEIYQMFEYSYDDGDLLVTEIIFPSVPIVKNNVTMSDIEKTLTNIRNSLMSRSVDPATKIIEVFMFVTFSFGIKSYDNPKIFTLPYGILVDTMIQFDLISQIPEHLSLTIKSAFVETVIMYCINCWKFDKDKHQKVYMYFDLWNITPYIPKRLKLFKFIVTLLLQGYRNSLLKEVLIYFSLPPSPHFLQNVINEALKNKASLDICDLLQYLKRQLQEEHFNCCSNVEKWKHWEFTTAGVKSDSSIDDETSCLSLSEIPNNVFDSQANAAFYKENKINKPKQNENEPYSDVEHENNELIVDENKKFNGRDNIKEYMHSEFTRLDFDSAELPGSLLASPVKSIIYGSPSHNSIN